MLNLILKQKGAGVRLDQPGAFPTKQDARAAQTQTEESVLQVEYHSSSKSSPHFETAIELDFLAPQWRAHLRDEFLKPYMSLLREFLKSERKNGKEVFPPKDKIFRALFEVDYDMAKVVLLGQDPYHGPGQAMGLSFAVSAGTAVPPSLRNIFQELSADLNVPVPRDTTLLGWAQQGVLLLNTVLTVRNGEAFSHRKKGWETFTDEVIRKLGQRTEPLVFLLWGSAAHQKTQLISNPNHLILKSVHPSPLSAHRGFFGSRPFSQANAFLKANGQREIEWTRV